MQIKSLSILPLLLIALHPAAQSATDDELAAISEMGKLNAVALHCQYIDQVQRIKRELVANLPQRRELGAWFEQTTNDAYLGFINDQSTCPGPQVFTVQVDQAAKKLQQIYNR